MYHNHNMFYIVSFVIFMKFFPDGERVQEKSTFRKLYLGS